MIGVLSQRKATQGHPNILGEGQRRPQGHLTYLEKAASTLRSTAIHSDFVCFRLCLVLESI
jgi:hypothetical protein